jgi:hypothetical protein
MTRQRQGFMVAVVVTSLAILFGLAAAIVAIATGCLQLSVVSVQMEKSRFAAEAGLAAGLDRIANAPGPHTWPWKQDMSNQDQSFEVMVYDNTTGSGRIPSFEGGPQVPAGMLYVVSKGYCRGRHSHSVGSLVRKGDGGFQVGALAPFYYFARNNTLDAYDSRLGPYGPDSKVNNANLLATNANGNPSATQRAFDSDHALPVDGKIFVGTSGDPDQMISPGISAQGVAHLAKSIDLPAITLPGGLPVHPSVELDGNYEVTLPPGQYDRVKAFNGARINLVPGGEYIIGDLVVWDDGELVASTGNSTLYVTNLMTFKTNAIVNTTKIPKNLRINYTGTQNAYIAGGAMAYFTLLAPNALIDSAEGGDIYGALMSNVGIEFSDETTPTHFHYDVSLQNLQTGTSTTFQVLNRHRI